MCKRMPLQHFLDAEGLTLDEALEVWGYESVVPALCEDYCEVEPDGYCCHGHPSILIEVGVI